MNSILSTPEFNTPAEAVLVILPQRVDFRPCMGLDVTAYYHYFKPDVDPNKYQSWTVYSGVSMYGPFSYDTYMQTLSPDAIGHSAGYKKQCPTPLTRPEVPYTPDVNGRTCSRPDNLTITLSGGTEVEPSKGSDIKTLPFIATIKDNNQPPNHPVEVKIRLKVDPTSGGHEHTDNNRPRGGIAELGTCPSDSICWTKQTDSNGTVVFNFNAPEASGTHTITATCDACSNNPQTARVDVKVPGLEKIPESPFLYTIQLPNRDTNHPATYFLTRASAEKLRIIALYYYAFTFARNKQGVVPDFVLNDASLEWGGVLDCFLTCNSAQYPSTPWHKHHVEHRRGSVVDIKANGAPGSVVYDSDFRFWAAEFGVNVGRLHGSGGGLHYHVRLNNNQAE